MIAARIRRMSRRRQKIAWKRAIARKIECRLQPFVGRPLTPELREEMLEAMMDMISPPKVEIAMERCADGALQIMASIRSRAS